MQTLMDSQWFHQATASNGGFNDKNNAGNMVDLNLKLGLANDDDTNHQINLSDLFNKPVPITTPSLAKFTFNGPNTSDKEINPRPTNGAGKHVGRHFGTICNGNGIALNTKGLGNGKRNATGNEIGMMVGGLPSHGGQVHFISSTQEIGNQPHSIKINNIVMDNAAKNTSSMLRAGGYTNLLSNFNTNLLPAATLKNYKLLDFSSKDAQIGSSYRSPRRYLNRRREVCYNDPRKTCYNIHCRTNNTPMWRRGPLGARTLCNACGIRHRKEEDRKRARKEADNRQNGN